VKVENKNSKVENKMANVENKMTKVDNIQLPSSYTEQPITDCGPILTQPMLFLLKLDPREKDTNMFAR
jgi:hypothetical protein